MFIQMNISKSRQEGRKRKPLLKITELVLDDLVIYVDLCKTFDTVPGDILISKLLQYLLSSPETAKSIISLRIFFMTRWQVISPHFWKKKENFYFATLEFCHSAKYIIYSSDSAKVQYFLISHCYKKECLCNTLHFWR